MSFGGVEEGETASSAQPSARPLTISNSQQTGDYPPILSTLPHRPHQVSTVLKRPSSSLSAEPERFGTHLGATPSKPPPSPP